MRRRFSVQYAGFAACLCAAVVVAGCGGGGGQAEPFTLAGTVTSESGPAIAGAVVTATVSGQSQPVGATTTTSTGVYGFVLPPATYVVEASAAGFVAQQQIVTITASQPRLSVDFSLSPVSEPPPTPATVAGRVTNAVTSAPISGATVTATLQGQTTPLETTTTNADGEYGFILGDGSYVIRVTAAGFVSAQRTVTVTLPVANLGVDFALTPS